MLERRLAAAVEEALDDHVESMADVSGGDVSSSHRVALASGRFVFAKIHGDPPPHFFETEADGLRWMRDALDDDGPVQVPAVLAVGADHLVLEWIEEGSARTRFAVSEADLGRGLAVLHRGGAEVFGRLDGRTTGSRALPNEPVATWAEHYAANRLMPLAERWQANASLPAAIAGRLAALAERLDVLGVPDEPPARLHGDLWAGNRIIGRRLGGGLRHWLIDPAAHGGHREFDLAMMRLFGGFDEPCFAAYDEVFPLTAGWEARVPLHQLAPLAVHAIKFGGGYVAATDLALDHVDHLP
ncbi:MAG: fructosamine kinase family protein [Actinomycetota bacterium]